ncbi:MAG: hypothetical protein ACT4P3_03150 [Betaproteobacteria bacterium]
MTGLQVLRSMMQCLGAVLLLGVFTNALAYKPTDESVAKMSLREARSQFLSLIRDYGVDAWGQSLARAEVTITTDRIELKPVGMSKPLILPFKDMPQIEFGSFTGWVYLGPARGDHVYIRSKGEQFANALHRLKMESIRAADPAAESAFAAAAEQYRAANPKPEFPEDARRYRVQAEAMLRDKLFMEAAEFYGEALRIAPWWPEGRFNRALVLGEVKDYAEAGREMKRYLQLVPDAPNARAAQDKIYEWESKAGRAR